MFFKKKNKDQHRSESIMEKRIINFKKIKRAYYSLIILSSLYILSIFCPLLMNNQPLAVKYENAYYFPAFTDFFDGFLGKIFKFKYYNGADFGQSQETSFRELKKIFKEENKGNWVMMPPYPYGPIETPLSEFPEGVEPPTAPDAQHWFGTDTQGRDIFARASYGFFISISFGLLVTLLSYIFGIGMGALLGYFGGRLDLYGLRIIEIFSTLPFLFVMMIMVKFARPSFIFLAAMYVVIKGWIGITYYVRAEFYREKARDYVAAATAMGQSNFKIMFKHILPNALTSVITFAPFAIIGYISSLVALDFLGFGLPTPTPSWGELIQQGSNQDTKYWWIIITPLVLLFLTLTTVTFIGEGVRQAFDPKEYSRLR